MFVCQFKKLNSCILDNQNIDIGGSSPGIFIYFNKSLKFFTQQFWWYAGNALKIGVPQLYPVRKMCFAQAPTHTYKPASYFSKTL